ncbi:hypothetical protein ACUXZJ_12045 [Flavobacterium sp. TN-1]
MKIINLLNIHPEQYSSMLFETYMHWCTDFCTKNYEQELQSLLANAPINKYFLMEYRKLEAEFLEMAKEYQKDPNITPEDYRELYADCTVKIFNRHQKALVRNAKITTIINNYECN